MSAIPYFFQILSFLDCILQTLSKHSGKLYMSVFLFGAVCAVSLLSRLYKISWPCYVCWDETHFGKMAGLYINGTYFNDVHPPLGKLIIAFFGWISGYNGTFSFENPGDMYLDGHGEYMVPYMYMRVGCATLGCMTIAVAGMIVHEATESKTASLLTSLLLVCDVGLVTLSRFILLDPIMLFFMFSSVLGAIKLSSHQSWSQLRVVEQDHSFRLLWWTWLVFTGISLGCAVSVKFVGIFTVLYVGLWTASDLWTVLGFIPIHGSVLFWKHFVSRIVCLILLPLSIYVGIFSIHFMFLVSTGDGAVFHSSKFQAGLKDNALFNLTMPVYGECDSLTTLRNFNIERMYLHSHNLLYPVKADQVQLQQVTGYPLRDANNEWKVICASTRKSDGYLRNGDLVKLNHFLTKKSATTTVDEHNHWKTAPLTTWHLMVAAMDSGNSSNGQWEIHGSQSLDDEQQKVCTVDCLIKLKNSAANCYLCSTNKGLPEWGKKQHEITCTNSPRHMGNCLWYIESSRSAFGNVPMKTIPTLSFSSKLIEAHQVMFHLNSKLVRSPGDPASKPWQWPLNNKPKLFSKHEDHLYLKGTPIVWWINLLALPAFLVIAVVTAVIDARNESAIRRESPSTKSCQENNEDFNIYRIRRVCCWFFLGWLLHYLPFFAMSRVLFFHHYFPAHIFACMLSATLLDLLSITLADSFASVSNLPSRSIHHTIVTILSSIVFHNFYTSWHLCYGA